MKKRYFLLLIASLFIWGTADSFAQQRRASTALEHGAHRIGKRVDADMQQWREHGLGQFIHWGVYAIPGGHWEGKFYTGAAEWIRSWKEMPKEAYDNLYKEFNPTSFDAKAWAKMAKEMGVKYLIFTTKHHDGFCLWPSKYTDYTIANSPYKKDIVKEIVDAYNAEGIDVHLYFSIIDWNHPGYRSAAPLTKHDKDNYGQFLTFTANQLKELLTNYPTVKGLWFDGSWDKAWIEEAAWVDELGKELRAMKPGLVIGSRFRADENGKRHYDTNGDLIDDYDQTWERDLPKSMADLNGVDWDCVMTVPENQWGYHSDWKGYVKTSYDLIEMMAHSVSMDGNFVLNFGPDGKGNIRPEETLLAKEIGEWMKINYEAIYGAGHAGLEKQGWGYYTQKGNKVYMLVFNPSISKKLKTVFPRGGSIPEKAYFLDGQKEMPIIDGGRNKQNERIFYISIPEKYTSDQPFVIVLDLKDNSTDKDSYQQAKT
ncbi:alpha-L-fucosidase [Parabacteroides sp. PFB2-10]|uniref:alpha-L-fucosidase n=1 Tax=Parabacteroides sp. PFB2-10 TaxID=1742405 RepID=UPI0024743573|nr:alpha-L-fucosidase [Parabacteroides sp. PFB2-10]MDH6314020.1 alpha-L-fucosidase [Parabacteroides sp. PFB2-10]MDL2245222.1 alpha-L-fucosidase [Parabacteroides sp. OttesenSCG-928-J18]